MPSREHGFQRRIEERLLLSMRNRLDVSSIAQRLDGWSRLTGSLRFPLIQISQIGGRAQAVPRNHSLLDAPCFCGRSRPIVATLGSLLTQARLSLVLLSLGWRWLEPEVAR